MDAIAQPMTFVQPKPFEAFTEPDLSGKTDFKDVVTNLTTYFTAQSKTVEPMILFSGALSAKILNAYHKVTLLYDRAPSPLSPDQLASAQTTRDECVKHIQFLSNQCKTIDTLVSALFKTQEFLAQTIRETGDVKTKTLGTQSVIRAAEENHTSAKELKTKVDEMWLSAAAVAKTLEDRTSSAHQKASQLIICLDTNRGGALTRIQNATLAALGGGELTLHKPKSPVHTTMVVSDPKPNSYSAAAGAPAQSDTSSKKGEETVLLKKKKHKSPPASVAGSVAAASATAVVATVPPKA